MIASLPMYDRPETRGAYSRLWDHIRANMGDLAPPLTHPKDPWAHWHSPELFISQTCGLPFRLKLHGKVHLVGTPDYGLPGCGVGYYNSVIVMRNSDDRTNPVHWPDLKLAVNSFHSQSGWAAACTYADDLGTSFGSTLETGSHLTSARAVAEGGADIAAIDAQSWRMMLRWDSFTKQLQEVDRTPPTPGLPLITASPARCNGLFAAFENCLNALPDEDRAILDIKGLTRIPAELYLAEPTPPLHSGQDRA